MMVTLFLCVVFFVAGAPSVKAKTIRRDAECAPDRLTVYKVFLHTFWDRETFPKQYPEWRPPAQWSKLVGRSHDDSYVLFRLDKKASEGLQMFAESGQTDVLDSESQGEGGVYDEFNAPPITEGVGKSEAEFFVDGNHSRVSLVSRVVPSPDWFIGVDSFSLCVDGKWVESVVLEVDPMDGGTDNGFTFTSPNWPTVPQAVVSRISAQTPDHPANSFYYPERKEHPPIATFHFVKVKEYELARVFQPQLAHQVYDMESVVASSTKYPEVSNNAVLPPPTKSHHGIPSRKDAKHVLLNNIVDQYKKKYKKNRRGRKMIAKATN